MKTPAFAPKTLKAAMHPRPFYLLSFVAVLLSAVLLAAAPATLDAQSVSFAGAQTVFSALNANGIAVDGSGNVYIASGGTVYKETLQSNGAYAQSLVASGFGNPLTSAAADGSGNVYVGDAGGNVYKETLQSNGTYVQNPLGTNFMQIQALAVDGSGNVYIAVNGGASVVEEVLSNGAYAPITVESDAFAQALAVDGAGNVYIDSANSVIEETPSNGTYLATTLTIGVTDSFGIAVDESGNLYITEYGGGVYKETLSNGTYVSTELSTLANPLSVAVDATGDVFIADTNNNRVVEVQTQSVNFGAANVCPAGQTTPAPCAQTLTLNYNVMDSGTLGTPSLLTGGAPNLDFALASGNTCTGQVTAGSSCAVNVTFAPRLPGARNGAVQIVDGSGNVLSTNYIYGAGTGPAIAFGPGTPVTVASGFLFATGVAIDGSGNIYVADGYAGQVYKETLSGGAYTQTTVVSGLVQPEGVALDGAGNVYITDAQLNEVLKEMPISTGYAQTIVANGLDYPASVAVDGSGNVYIADFDSGNVFKETLADGAYTQTTAVGGLSTPAAVAIDASGSIYIINSDNGQVLKETPSGGAYIQTTVASGLVDSSSVAVDASGNVYVANPLLNQVLKEAPSGGTYTQTIVSSGLNGPTGVAVDANANVYITGAAAESQVVMKLDIADAPTLSFAATHIGTHSSDSPQSVTVENVGNAALSAIAPGLSIPANFLQENGSGTPLDCTGSFSLTPAATCNLSISFIPTARAPLSGVATLTDNALNALPSATQSINLSGGGALLTTTTTSLSASPNPSIYGEAVTLTANVSPSSATGQVTFLANGTILGTATLNAGTATLMISSLMPATYTLDAEYGGDAGDLSSSNTTPYSLTVGYTASTPASGTECNGVYQSFDGDVKVSKGQKCTFVNGTVTGTLLPEAGNVLLVNTTVTKNLEPTDGSTVTAIGATVLGNVQSTNSTVVMTDSTVNENVQSTNSTVTLTTTHVKENFEPTGGTASVVKSPIDGSANINGATATLTSSTVGGNVQSTSSNVTVTSTHVKGNLKATKGTATLTESPVDQNVSISAVTSFAVISSIVGDNLLVQNLPDPTGVNQICGTTVKGNLAFEENGTAVLIGAPPACAGNTIDGNLQVLYNSAAVTIEANIIIGNLQVLDNSVSATIVGNTVNGSLQDEDNKTNQVSNNVVGNTLQCQNNSPITGGGNTASSKQGQCSTF